MQLPVSRTLDSFLGFPFSLLPCYDQGHAPEIGCRAPLVSPPHLPWLLQCQAAACVDGGLIGAPWKSESPRQDAPSYSFWEPHPHFLSVPALPLEGCWLGSKRWQFFTHSSCGLQASFPRMPAPPKANLCFSLTSLKCSKAEITIFSFSFQKQRVHNIPLRQWSCLLTQASDASSLIRVYVALHDFIFGESTESRNTLLWSWREFLATFQ